MGSLMIFQQRISVPTINSPHYPTSLEAIFMMKQDDLCSLRRGKLDGLLVLLPALWY
ncbi:MAG: hypothetical protein R3C11_25650 [Planctomycetaceae bacterium]